MKALIFDVFGTLTDWRGGIAREAERLLAPLGYTLDWPAFADAWRARYQPAMEEIRAGSAPFAPLDALHRRMLADIAPQFGLEGLAEETAAALVFAWHRLDAWPDVTPGLTRLHRRFIIAPCSNGHIALMIALARRNGFPWDAILGAEIARDYKPKPRAYLATAEALALAPGDIFMVAAHSADLAAAAALGFKTAHVARPQESPAGESAPRLAVDIAVQNLGELADRLGA
jgi:2-haloacid dehalogenase